MVAIYGLSQLLSTELSATPNMPESQRRMMRVIPLVVVIFVFQFTVPAGLVLYWMTTNLWTCGQQLVMRHRIGLHLADPAEVEKYGEKLNIAKKGSRTPARSRGRRRARRTAEDAASPPRRPGRAGADAAAPWPRPRRVPDAGEAEDARRAPEAETAPEPAERAGAGRRPPDDRPGESRAGRQGQGRAQRRPPPAAPEGHRQGLAARERLPLQEEALTGGESWEHDVTAEGPGAAAVGKVLDAVVAGMGLEARRSSWRPAPTAPTSRRPWTARAPQP